MLICFGSSVHFCVPAMLAADVTIEPPRSSGRTVDELLRALAESLPVARLSAGVELAYRFPDRLPEAAIREMLDTMWRLEDLELADLANQYHAAASAGEDLRDLSQDIVMGLAHLNSGQADFAVP